MKVALVAEWLDAWRGGAEASTLQFMHHLMASGVELHVFTRSRPSPTPGLNVHTISGASMSRTRQSMTFAHRVVRAIQTGQFDIVHAISPCLLADIYQPRGGTIAETIDRNIALRPGRMSRSLKRGAARINFKQRYQLAMERRLLGGESGPIVVAISEYVVRQLKKHYQLPDERIRMIYNGVDADPSTVDERTLNRRAIRREYDIGDDDVLVMAVAHNFRLKGIARWMEAQRLLINRGRKKVRSLVIGKGDAPRWHRLASRLGVSSHLSFIGPSERVRAFHHAADVLVHPTYYDPCSRVVLEGMAAGLPCITTRWDGAAEMIRHGENGYVLDDPWDVEAIADCVDGLCDAGFRSSMGNAARDVIDRASMARHAEAVLALFEELAAGVSHCREA